MKPTKLFIRSVILILLSASFSDGICQDLEIQKLIYSKTINGKLADYQEVWIFNDLIFRFNQQDTSEFSLTDFNNNTVTINAFGRPKTISIEAGRKQVNKLLSVIGRDTILYCSHPEIGLNSLGEEISASTDSIWFDINVSVAKYARGGFNGFLDNGYGYLPVRFVRIINNYQSSEISRIEFLLQSKDNIYLKRELLIKYVHLE